MPGGAYSALSGMRARLEELDRLAADLANISTAGYKTERAGTRVAERGEFASALDSAVDVVAGQSRIDFRPGTIATTSRDLDVAIEGRGFFVLDTPAGPRYTRNGAFTRRADGLLTTTQGEPVLGESGEIALGKGPITIEADGTITSGGTVLGQIQIVEFEHDTDLVRESGARFRAIAGATPRPAEGKLLGGALEQSNASVVDLMAKLTEVSRGFESLQRGVATLTNDLDGRAIAELARR
ncbi:MAG: flagellar hook basal-body protein [Acidobacteria bacterium]|nr:flagellar hook basal-body protein [Acidobacteriota bacterium]